MESFKIVSNEWYLCSNRTPQTAVFGFFINGIENNIYEITNHILSIFEIHVYKNRERSMELSRLINEVKKVNLLEENSAQNHVRKLGMEENSQDNKDIILY